MWNELQHCGPWWDELISSSSVAIGLQLLRYESNRDVSYYHVWIFRLCFYLFWWDCKNSISCGTPHSPRNIDEFVWSSQAQIQGSRGKVWPRITKQLRWFPGQAPITQFTFQTQSLPSTVYFSTCSVGLSHRSKAFLVCRGNPWPCVSIVHLWQGKAGLDGFCHPRWCGHPHQLGIWPSKVMMAKVFGERTRGIQFDSIKYNEIVDSIKIRQKWWFHEISL